MSSARVAAPLDRHQVVAWRNAIFVVFALPGLALASWVSRLPAARDILDISPAQIGLLILGISIGSIVGLVASSHVVAVFGAAATLTWGMIGIAAGILIAGLAITLGASFALGVVGLVVFGASMGITDVAMNVSGAANERALGRSIMPIFHAFFSFGTMIGAGLGALAELAGISIALHLGLASAVLVISVLLVRRFIQSEHVIEDEHSVDGESASAGDGHHAADPAQGWRGRLAIWRDPRTLLIGVVVLAAAFAEGSANDWLAIASVDGHGVNNETGALIFGVFVTAMTIGRLGGVLVLDRFGRVTVLRASFLLAVVGLLIFIFVPNTPVAVVGVVLWGLGSALGFPIGMSAAADDPKTAAAKVSAVATIGYFAFLVGPPVIGLLGEYTGVMRALLIVLVLAAVGSIVAGAAREPEKAAALS